MNELIEICQQEKMSFTLRYDCGFREFYEDNKWKSRQDSPGFTITVNGYGFTDAYNNERKYKDLEHTIEAGLELAKMAVSEDRKF